MKKNRQFLLNSIRNIEDFPQQGIVFKDITTLLNDKKAFKITIKILAKRCKKLKVDYICGTESRGFIFAAAVAAKLGLRFVPIRKPAKLPAEVFSQKYDLEYGSSELQIHKDAFAAKKYPKVALIDDLIATGGTAVAAANLISMAGGRVAEACFVVDLVQLGGAKILKERGISVFSILEV